MKNTWIILSCALLALAGCKDKKIYCIDIGDTLKNWTMYDLNDSIVMKDQLGNISVHKISKYNNSAKYYQVQKGGLLKKLVDCHGTLTMSSADNFLSLDVMSTSSELGSVRNPDDYDVRVILDQSMANFRVKRKNNVETIYPQNIPQTALEQNYTSIGGTVYPEAIVFNVDTTVSNLNVYNFVYVSNKGLAEYSTKVPQRTWKLQ